jgi:hypothetical protein
MSIAGLSGEKEKASVGSWVMGRRTALRDNKSTKVGGANGTLSRDVSGR